ncbi:MAG: GntR family transcriptional regulator [Ancylobacter novellus]|uniref:GntR family transcriptional regulator n=1 Tax=Ancylobacter novellus TaxID=921 RepID=A0A2W5KH36_ANCNO|nr:MAG: GntR family transcriptional regulator [Ancylobacter novellus]
MASADLNIQPLDDAPSLKWRTYDALKNAIAGIDIYQENAPLRLDERALSLRFGVSRTPLREALAQLELEGLVRIVPRRGIYIARKTKTEMLETISVWAALESMAARLACEVATDEEIEGLHALVDGFNGADVCQHMFEYSDVNIRFHQAIIALSRCKMIAEMTNGLFFHVRAIRRRTIYEQDRARRSVVDHKDIVEAIEARNGERAERLVREHTLKLRDHVDRYVALD